MSRTSYYEAKAALKLFKESELPMSQLHALDCIINDKKIKLYSFPKSLVKRNKNYEKYAARFLSTEKYSRLTKEEAMKEYASFVKMYLQFRYNAIFFANKILTDPTISDTPHLAMTQVMIQIK